jgi:hypothetical protein
VRQKENGSPQKENGSPQKKITPGVDAFTVVS